MDILEAPEHVNVAIIGAGISGIAAAVQLRGTRPDLSAAIFEMRSAIGGTWDLFRFPGVRSDSDMYTLGFSFKPWTRPEAVASGTAIRAYLEETVAEFELLPLIHFEHHLEQAAWDSATNHWTLRFVTHGRTVTVTCDHIYLGVGYYSYRGGFNPALPGEADFAGTMVHPQDWPSDLDHDGRTVAVIGSGATAVTLVPALAETARHVTMVQRSPTYYHVAPRVDEEANELRDKVGAAAAFRQIRLRNTQRQQELYAQARAAPAEVAAALFAPLDEIIGKDMRTAHFTPSYAPWDQRLCLAPDAELFLALQAGSASVVTGDIDRLHEHGIRMRDGTAIDADIIVKATGLNLNIAGDIAFTVDGDRVDFSKTFTYKGMGYSGVPNLVSAFGFLNSSWTLRLELVNDAWLRILARMDELGAERFTPRLRTADHRMTARPFLTDMTSGYLQRAAALLPRQGHDPWIHPQVLSATEQLLGADPESDGALVFEGRV